MISGKEGNVSNTTGQVLITVLSITQMIWALDTLALSLFDTLIKPPPRHIWVGF